MSENTPKLARYFDLAKRSRSLSESEAMEFHALAEWIIDNSTEYEQYRDAVIASRVESKH